MQSDILLMHSDNPRIYQVQITYLTWTIVTLAWLQLQELIVPGCLQASIVQCNEALREKRLFNDISRMLLLLSKKS